VLAFSRGFCVFHVEGMWSCGRPQGGGSQAHVDRGVKNSVHKGEGVKLMWTGGSKISIFLWTS